MRMISSPGALMKKTGFRSRTVLPLGIKHRSRTELPALVALTAIGEPWFCKQHQTDLLVVALVVQELAPADSLEAQCAFRLREHCEKPITAEDKVDVALNLAECLPWLQLQPNHLVDRAIQSIASRS